MIKETQSTLKNYEHKSNRHWVASGLTALGVTVLTISPLVTTTTSILQPTTVFATDNARNLTVTEQLQIARLQAAIPITKPLQMCSCKMKPVGQHN